MNFNVKYFKEEFLLKNWSDDYNNDLTFTVDQLNFLKSYLSKGGEMDHINTLEEEVKFLRAELQRHIDKIDLLCSVIEKLEANISNNNNGVEDETNYSGLH